MAAFEYQALNQKGRTVKGVATGDHARQVREELRVQGLVPLEVVAVSGSKSSNTKETSARKARRLKISASELSVTTRQMATLLGSGLTIEETLKALIEQAERHQLKTVMTDIRSLVNEGYSLSDAVGTYPRSFPEIYRASILAGEQSGNLPDVLERLADYLEARYGIQQRLSVALVYPIFLTVVAILIVVPRVVQVFEDTGQTLPALTRYLIATSEFLQAYGIFLLGGLLLVGFAAHTFFRQPHARYWLHGFYLKIPALKRFVRSVNTARMSRTLSIMVSSGVPLLGSLKATEGVITNDVMREGLRVSAAEVAEGVSISRALERSGHWPPLLIQMVSSGENSGRLGSMLEKSASATESELESRINMMVGLFEPIMILIMGAAVLVIVLAILMPIFDLNQLIT